MNKPLMSALPGLKRKSKKFSVNDRIKHGDNYINKIIWQNQIIDDLEKYYFDEE